MTLTKASHLVVSLFIRSIHFVIFSAADAEAEEVQVVDDKEDFYIISTSAPG